MLDASVVRVQGAHLSLLIAHCSSPIAQRAARELSFKEFGGYDLAPTGRSLLSVLPLLVSVIAAAWWIVAMRMPSHTTDVNAQG